jgi:Protein of unknown function (DUF3987)
MAAKSGCRAYLPLPSSLILNGRIMSPEIVSVSSETFKRRETFFKVLFRDSTGYLCLAYKGLRSKKLSQKFFKYPEELTQAIEHIEQNYNGKDTYFCTQLLDKEDRHKEHALPTALIWADVDTNDASFLEPKPSVLVKSSDNHYHAYWLLKEAVPAITAEDISKRLAYFYRERGVDTKGWDLTQLLRVPLTYNVKYSIPSVVKVVDASGTQYAPADFDQFPTVLGTEYLYAPMEDITGLDAEDILEQYKDRLNPKVYLYFSRQPKGTWSEVLWNFECMLFEAGMNRKEVFVVASDAACNKYARDNRPPQELWIEVNKAEATIGERKFSDFDSGESMAFPALLNEDERRAIKNDYFIDDYVKWAAKTTDAPAQFHEAVGFTILSTILCSQLELNMTDAKIIPNLWFMITGSTTTDRKSTCMDKGMSIIKEIDDDALLATDGSVEGILHALETRPGRASIFHRDEFSGMLAQMEKRDYLAGMPEALTRLYDGQSYRRVLRRENINVEDPRVIFLCGGIRTRILEHLTTDFIVSGFVPRFVFVDSEDQVREIMPVGMATEIFDSAREEIIDRLKTLVNKYKANIPVSIAGKTVMNIPTTWRVVLTQEAIDKYNELERIMVRTARQSASPDLFEPTMMRLCKSTLKAAVLLSASRQDPRTKGFVDVDVGDLNKAITYCENWRKWSCMIVENAGQTYNERTLSAINNRIESTEFRGMKRADIMRAYHLRARQADEIFATLIQQGLVVKTGGQGVGRQPETYYSSKHYKKS